MLHERVLVTGAAGGIGLATAVALNAASHRVFVADRDEEALGRLLRTHPTMAGITTDVSDARSVTAMVAAAGNALGAVDALVNVVGVPGQVAAIEEVALNDWTATFAANVTGPLVAMQAVVHGMKARGHGAIINVSTTSVATGLPMRSAYVASKAALEALTRNAARELGPSGIACNVVRPGVVDNERGRRLVQAFAERQGLSEAQAIEETLRYVSMRVMVTPEDVAMTIRFLLSDTARRISGQIVAVDGNVEWDE